MDQEDLQMLECYIDRYGIVEVLSGISYICSEKAEHVAVNWQDTQAGKQWMTLSTLVDGAAARVEKGTKDLH